MLPRVSIESAGHNIDADFARALPAMQDFDLDQPIESLRNCMRFADTAFLLEFTGENPKAWSYRAQAGVEALKGIARYADCLGEQPDQRFTLDVLVPSYLEVVAADQPLVQRVTAIANGAFYSGRKLTIPIHHIGGAAQASHILTLCRVNLVIPQIRPETGGVSRLTPRERECISLTASGLVTKQIASEMGISEKTVELHRARAREKLGARTTAQAVAMIIAGAAWVEKAFLGVEKEDGDCGQPADDGAAKRA